MDVRRPHNLLESTAVFDDLEMDLAAGCSHNAQISGGTLGIVFGDWEYRVDLEGLGCLEFDV